MTPEQQEEMNQKVKRMIERGLPDLIIRRVPKISLSEFKEFAKTHYEDDYGMALVFLWNYYKGVIFNGYDTLIGFQDKLEERITALESLIFVKEGKDKVEEKKPVKGRKLLSGKTIGE